MEREWTEEEMAEEVKKLTCKYQREKQETKYGACHGVAHLRRAIYTEPQLIACKWCGSTDIMKRGTRKGVQNYICKSCGRVFIAKDAPYHMQTSVEQIGASLSRRRL